MVPDYLIYLFIGLKVFPASTYIYVRDSILWVYDLFKKAGVFYYFNSAIKIIKILDYNWCGRHNGLFSFVMEIEESCTTNIQNIG